MKTSSEFRGRVIMMVSKVPCIVTGDGEDVRQELAPRLRNNSVKGTWKAIRLESTHSMKCKGGKEYIYNCRLL